MLIRQFLLNVKLRCDVNLYGPLKGERVPLKVILLIKLSCEGLLSRHFCVCGLLVFLVTQKTLLRRLLIFPFHSLMKGL